MKYTTIFLTRNMDNRSKPQPIQNFTSWGDIIRHYRKFLKGQINQCPTHGGPLEEESELLIINKHRILTVDSQPGKSSDEFQRAYVECYMHNEQLNKIKKLQFSDLIIFTDELIYLDESDYPLSCIAVTGSKDNNEVYTSMPIYSGWDINVYDALKENIKRGNRTKVLKNLFCVKIIDPQWGREKFLFEEFVRVLSE